ncbi:MAG: tRNA pseudouridine(38-40) synthase TruA [Candidatus Aminicenantes bacterium]|nr:tRNA pseudouridine(38-40) synthase TruA [Candidatus Aminicenantes bacterium]
MISNHKIVISYDGTDYFGWQRQKKQRTIQGEIEDSLEKILSKKIPVIGSGRTDAGVHARGQTAHFKADTHLHEKELLQALNGTLPRDIRIVSLHKISFDFNARKSAKSKIYRYRICNSPVISPFILRYVLHWPSPLDIAAMEDAAARFIREADFTPFSSNRELYPVRRIMRSECIKRGTEIVTTVEANGFLRYMVRSIVGTLIEVGRGRMLPEDIEILFRNKMRSRHSPTAPAKGLCLVKVKY